MKMRQLFFRGMTVVVFYASGMLFCAEQQQQLMASFAQQNQVAVILVFSNDGNREVHLTREQANRYGLLRNLITDYDEREYRFVIPDPYGTVETMERLNNVSTLSVEEFIAYLKADTLTFQERLQIIQLADYLLLFDDSTREKLSEKWDSITHYLAETISSAEDCSLIEQYSNSFFASDIAHTMLKKAPPQLLDCLMEKNDEYIETFSPCGRFFATWTRNILNGIKQMQINVWNTEEGLCIRSFDIENRFLQTRSLQTVSFSHNGQLLLIAPGNNGMYSQNTIDIMNINTGECEYSIENGTFIDSVVFNKDDTLVLAVSKNCAKIWDVKTGHEVQTFKHSEKIDSAVLSKDETLVLTVSNKCVKIWDVKTGHEVKSFDCNSRVHSAQFGFENTTVLTHSFSGGVKIWDVNTGEERHQFDIKHFDTLVLFSQDGKSVVTFDWIYSNAGTVYVRDVHTGDIVCTFDEYVGVNLGTIISGEKLVLYYKRNKEVEIRDMKTGDRLCQFYFRAIQENKIIVSSNDAYMAIGKDVFVFITKDVDVSPLEAWHLLKLFEISAYKKSERFAYIKNNAVLFRRCSESLKKKLKLMGLDVDVLCSGDV